MVLYNFRILIDICNMFYLLLHGQHNSENQFKIWLLNISPFYQNTFICPLYGCDLNYKYLIWYSHYDVFYVYDQPICLFVILDGISYNKHISPYKKKIKCFIWTASKTNCPAATTGIFILESGKIRVKENRQESIQAWGSRRI